MPGQNYDALEGQFTPGSSGQSTPQPGFPTQPGMAGPPPAMKTAPEVGAGITGKRVYPQMVSHVKFKNSLVN